jgi:hypothetical protein
MKLTRIAGLVLTVMLSVGALSSAHSEVTPASPAPTTVEAPKYVFGQAPYRVQGFQLAGGNTSACKHSCDRALERCMEKNATNCQSSWRFCNDSCEKSS